MKDGGASAEGNALAAAHAVLGKERKGLKRLTSILLALLMLAGMALAEETPDDTLMGNWYGLNAQTIIRLTMKEDGEFKLVVGYLSYTGSWQ